jgi:hypothetical protein
MLKNVILLWLSYFENALWLRQESLSLGLEIKVVCLNCFFYCNTVKMYGIQCGSEQSLKCE